MEEEHRGGTPGKTTWGSSLSFIVDRLANVVDITTSLQFAMAEMVRGLRIFLNMDRSQHHSTDCWKKRKREVEKGSGRPSTHWGQKRSMVSHAASRQPLGDSLEMGQRVDFLRHWGYLDQRLEAENCGHAGWLSYILCLVSPVVSFHVHVINALWLSVCSCGSSGLANNPRQIAWRFDISLKLLSY